MRSNRTKDAIETSQHATPCPTTVETQIQVKKVPAANFEEETQSSMGVALPQTSTNDAVCTTRRKTLKKRKATSKRQKAQLPKIRFQCTVCNKWFNRNSDLIRHFRIHSGVTPFKCALCDMAFRRHDYRKKHQRDMHP